MKIRRFTQFRLIYSHKKEAAAPGISGLKPSKYAFFSRFQKAKHAFFFVILAVALIFPVPKTVFAFSIFDALFGKKPVKQEQNSQTVALLKANLSPDLGARGGGDTTIIDGKAILPERGPYDGYLAENQSDQISIYVVRDKDTISQIAEMFKVSRDTIIWANDIRGGIIKEGQKLVIHPISGIEYTIKEGDTLKKIAEKYGTDLDEVLKFNGLSLEKKLIVGEKIFILDVEGVAVRSVSGRQPQTSRLGGGSGPYYEGYYIRPITGGYLSQGLHGYRYNGVDLAGVPAGTPIVAAADGETIINRDFGWNGGYGIYVVIKHANGTQTLYAHNSANVVSAGQSVKQGQVIGYVGSTGRSTGPHVHFELRGAAMPPSIMR